MPKQPTVLDVYVVPRKGKRKRLDEPLILAPNKRVPGRYPHEGVEYFFWMLDLSRKTITFTEQDPKM